MSPSVSAITFLSFAACSCTRNKSSSLETIYSLKITQLLTVSCLLIAGVSSKVVVGKANDDSTNGTVEIVNIQDHNKTQYLNQNFEEGNYNYGYDIKPSGPNGQFHHENKATDAVVYGCYGYLDPNNKAQITFYISDAWGYRPVRQEQPVEVFYPAQNPEGTTDMKGEIIQWSELVFPEKCTYFAQQVAASSNLGEVQVPGKPFSSSPLAPLLSPFGATNNKRPLTTLNALPLLTTPAVSASTGGIVRVPNNSNKTPIPTDFPFSPANSGSTSTGSRPDESVNGTTEASIWDVKEPVFNGSFGSGGVGVQGFVQNQANDGPRGQGGNGTPTNSGFGGTRGQTGFGSPVSQSGTGNQGNVGSGGQGEIDNLGNGALGGSRGQDEIGNLGNGGLGGLRGQGAGTTGNLGGSGVGGLRGQGGSTAGNPGNGGLGGSRGQGGVNTPGNLAGSDGASTVGFFGPTSNPNFGNRGTPTGSFGGNSLLAESIGSGFSVGPHGTSGVVNTGSLNENVGSGTGGTGAPTFSGSTRPVGGSRVSPTKSTFTNGFTSYGNQISNGFDTLKNPSIILTTPTNGPQITSHPTQTTNYRNPSTVSDDLTHSGGPSSSFFSDRTSSNIFSEKHSGGPVPSSSNKVTETLEQEVEGSSSAIFPGKKPSGSNSNNGNRGSSSTFGSRRPSTSQIPNSAGSTQQGTKDRGQANTGIASGPTHESYGESSNGGSIGNGNRGSSVPGAVRPNGGDNSPNSNTPSRTSQPSQFVTRPNHVFGSGSRTGSGFPKDSSASAEFNGENSDKSSQNEDFPASCPQSCRSFGGSKQFNSEEIDYSQIPGAVVSNVPVIFYPDCSANAFSRPAVVPFCPSQQQTSCSNQQPLTMKFPPVSAYSGNADGGPSARNAFVSSLPASKSSRRIIRKTRHPQTIVV